MRKIGTMVVVSGVLIILGLVLIVIGNQMILEEINQDNGKISSSQALEISSEFNSMDTKGVFAIQIMEFKENTLSVRILDPRDDEIVFQRIDSEKIQEEFDLTVVGVYKLIIESNSDEEIQVFGAIGPLPDTKGEALQFISTGLLLGGMIGLVISIMLGLKRKRSV